MIRAWLAFSLILSAFTPLAYASADSLPHDVKILILKSTYTENGDLKPILGIKELGRVERCSRNWHRAAQPAWEQLARLSFQFNLLTEPTYSWTSATASLIMQGRDPATVPAEPALQEQPQYVTVALFMGLFSQIKRLKVKHLPVENAAVPANFPKYRLLVKHAPEIKAQIITRAGELVDAYPTHKDTSEMRRVLVAAELFGDNSPLATYLTKKELTTALSALFDPESSFNEKMILMRELSLLGSQTARKKLKVFEEILKI